MFVYSFEELDVWQLSREFTNDIYNLTSKYPKSELFGLTNQMRRAAVSVSSNIAEGVSRKTNKEKARFTSISFGSIIEILNQLIISRDLGFITELELSELRSKIEGITHKINNLYNAQIKDNTSQ